MFVQSTLILYHTEAFVKTEVGFTVMMDVCLFLGNGQANNFSGQTSHFGGQTNNFALNNGFNLDSSQTFQGPSFFNKSSFETPMVRKFNFCIDFKDFHSILLFGKIHLNVNKVC